MTDMKENTICSNLSRQGISDFLLFFRGCFFVMCRIDNLIFLTSLILDSSEPKIEMGQKLPSQDSKVAG